MIKQAQLALRGRNPDVLSCIANLSNDEVFTPPQLANRILDTLGEAWATNHGGANIWEDKTVRFLDPSTKSGVFLREITRRLTNGLAEVIPNIEQRVDHILTNQVFGIGLTKLTSLLARRSLYCSKHAKGNHSIAQSFQSDDGNVWFERTRHKWLKDRCTYCGAGRSVFERGDERETHAYAFIHTDNVENWITRIFGNNMHFDVIIGNPPYQIEADDSGQNILPIYNKFVEKAKDLDPKYIAMIIPSRWMAGGKWLDGFRADMLQDERIRTIVDYPDAAEAFPGVDIKGGICYFLWSREEKGDCAVITKRGETTIGPVKRRLNEFDVFVRDSRALTILRKVLRHQHASFAELVSPRDPFGPTLSSNFKDYHAAPRKGDLRLYINQADKRGETWVRPNVVTKNHHLIDTWKVLMPKAGPGNSGGHVIPDMVLSRPLVAEPGSVCTLTYIVIGPLASKKASDSVAAYLRTRFVRFLVSLRKPSQDAPRGVYTWVPQQQWNRLWRDDELYRLYDISKQEQAYISEMIRVMDPINE
jgi:site-specific DNA-methyltransferase (adenine-specific)